MQVDRDAGSGARVPIADLVPAQCSATSTTHAAADYSALRPIVDAEFGVVLGTYSVVEPELTGADVAQGIPLRRTL